jgi:KDO2-lipid IV(A) lauroyltransferase
MRLNSFAIAHKFKLNCSVQMAKSGKLKISLEYWAVRAVIGTIGALPLRLSMNVGRACGLIAYKLAGGLRRTGWRNLELAYPDLDEHERKRILRGCFESLGRQLGVFSHFPHITEDELHSLVEYDAEDFKIFLDALERGKGIIFLTAHLGAWELLSFAHSAFAAPLSFLVRPLDNPRVEEFVERIRARFGNQPIDKKSAARAALKILQHGGTLGILADLNSQIREGVFVPFFGHLACTTAGAAAIALKTDASVIPVCAVWEKERGKYVMYGLAPIELVRTGDAARDIETNTARFTAALETVIRQYPDQWLWIHKRWKTRPAGEPDLYDRNLDVKTLLTKFEPHAAD